MRKSTIWFALVVAVAAGAAALTVRVPAAATDVLLTGTITSSAGEKMEGVTVSARAEGQTFTTSVYTDDQGNFYFPPLPEGKYKVYAQAVGFDAGRAEMNLAGRGKKQDFQLKPTQNVTKQLSGDQWIAALPADTLSPETTEGREGFVHPMTIRGTAEETTITFIARDHDDAKLDAHVELLRRLASDVVAREPRARVSVDIEFQYPNMREAIDSHPRVVEAAVEAYRAVGVEPVFEPIRGGTDGSRLSAEGLPTPNLFTGGQDYHSLTEWASVQDMAAAAAMVVELIRIWAGPER